MSKDEVTLLIRRLAHERGGSVSLRVFLGVAGVSERWLRDQIWFAGWNQLVASLGIATRQFNTEKIGAAAVARVVARLAIELGRWPTEDDMRRARKRSADVPDLSVIRPLRRSGELARMIVALGDTDSELAAASALAEPHVPATDSSENDSGVVVAGYVYLLKSGRRYKVGRSNDPSRRFREIRIELPEESIQVHSIATDDPVGIEAYWHKRFAEKRVRSTEFFELCAADVKAFKRRKYQ